MLKKCAILGLLLLLVGGSALAWVYNETRNDQAQVQDCNVTESLRPEEYLAKYGHWYRLTPEEQNQLVLELDKDRESKSPVQLDREQQARLRADIDKLAAGDMHGGDIADFLYGRGWESQVELYKKHKEQMEIAETISTVCLAIGGTLFVACVGIWLLLLVARGCRAWKQRSPRHPVTEEVEENVPELTDIEHDAPEEAPETPEAPEVPEPPEERPRQRRKVLTRSEASPGSYASGSSTAESQTSDDLLPPALTRAGRGAPPTWAAHAETENEAVAVLMADEPSQDKGWSPEAQWSISSSFAATPEPTAQEEHISGMPGVSLLDPPEDRPAVDDTLKEQADDLQKQIAEFKQMAQNVQQASREQSEPLGSTLKELTQQVSAIREYAACQQDRVEKLQDGYDWGIIRTFCLRVIRCIDNVENRLAERPDKDGSPTHLEEIRDELIFALESSGVEQYWPEVNKEFRGQERLAEAVKQKEPAKKPEQAGKIARVIRPGYRYMVDDENFKVVRTAQVQLFG